MSTPSRSDSLLKIPSKASVKAQLRQYNIEAHTRGSHKRYTSGCPLCVQEQNR